MSIVEDDGSKILWEVQLLMRPGHWARNAVKVREKYGPWNLLVITDYPIVKIYQLIINLFNIFSIIFDQNVNFLIN